MDAISRYSVALALLGCIAVNAQELGTIHFPTSGAPAAQPAFLEGVKALHSFQFDEAAIAFERARRMDPDFALAYWGEAMSHNHPLWAQQDTEAARTVLEALAPTLEGRLAKAKTDKERAFLEAAERLFYGHEDKLARDHAYAEALAGMYARWPDDHEIAIFYALSLLGTVRPGDAGFRRQALAASVASEVFKANPDHPGAAHFIIHSFDDPDHAPLALPAARAYAGIAPAAAHALHMPSHIFVQLGMWNEAAKSNVDAYRAAVALNERLNLPEGREDFHTLSWLAYANLMLGKFEDARTSIELAAAAAERNPDAGHIQAGYLGMRARYILETGQWEHISLEGPIAHADHEAMPGMAMPQAGGNEPWLFVAGVGAAKRGDFATADQAVDALRALRSGIEGQDAYRAKPVAIMEKQVAAVAAIERGRSDDALRLAKEAVDIELTMSAPSGPPEPIKPALELYGELLLAAGRPEEAAAAFEQALLRTPKRTPSLLGLAQSARAAGDRARAREAYGQIVAMEGAAPSAPALREAKAFLDGR